MGGERQKTQLELALEAEGRGEAPKTAVRGTEPSAAKCEPERPAATEQLMEEVCEIGNLRKARDRVVANGGSPGIDGMTVEQLPGYLAKHGPAIWEQLLTGTYEPQPVKRVEIPKPDGGGMRKLGIPTALDRFVQQAVLQVLQTQWDPTFSEHSYGFRPNRSAHQAVAQAQEYIREGYDWVVDFDLEKFFDKVNHDILMGRVARRITDKRMLRLIRAFLNAGVMENGLVGPTEEGTPQGGPLSPLLSNLLLDELDRELERRGHRFVRFADDANIYVRSERAGKRVMETVTQFLTKRLRLKVNEEKSAVARPWERKFLGFSFTRSETPRRKIAPKAVKRFQERVRELTRHRKSVSVAKMVAQLGRYMTGWRAYFGYCETPSVLRDLDSWIRRRLRAVVWRQWRTGRRRYAALRKRGVDEATVAKTVGCAHGPWHLSRSPALHRALPTAFFDALGLPRLLAGNRSTNRTAVYGPVRTVV
jgi:RNA-directed DNA polymerase